MTNQVDKFWVARGVDADDLATVKGRNVIYAGLGLMSVTAVLLVVGTVMNIAGTIV